MEHKPSITFEEFSKKLFTRNPDLVETYLELSFEDYLQDGNTAALLEVLREITELRGGIPALAKRTGVTKQNLYRALSAKGNPKLATIQKIIAGLGYRITLEPLSEASESEETVAKPKKKNPLAEAKGVSV